MLKVGCFPEMWTAGLISPIFKNEDKTDPQNYCGICINSCLGKVSCNVLNLRITDFFIRTSFKVKEELYLRYVKKHDEKKKCLPALRVFKKPLIQSGTTAV